MQQVAPRHFTTGAGLPGDRSACGAARQAFLTLQLTFLQALGHAEDTAWLRALVLSAEEPVDLWLLRAPAFDALAGGDVEHRSRRRMLRRGLDSMFPDDAEPESAFLPF